MTIRTMTLDELRDWHAKREGWHAAFRHRHASGVEQWWFEHPDGREQFDHPYPATLDGAASAWPEGWTWSRFDGSWKAYHNHRSTRKEFPDTGDEVRDRYELAKRAIEATQEKGTNDKA